MAPGLVKTDVRVVKNDAIRRNEISTLRVH
jgi:hypothetical protein